MSIDLVTVHIKHTRSAPTNKSQNRGLSLTLHKRMLHFSNHNWGNHQQLLACLLHVLGSGIWECSCFILATGQPELSPPLKALRGLFGSSLSQTVFPSSAPKLGMMTRREASVTQQYFVITQQQALNPFSELERNWVCSVGLETGPGRPSATKACYTVIHPICVLSSVTSHVSPPSLRSSSSHSSLSLDAASVSWCHV